MNEFIKPETDLRIALRLSIENDVSVMAVAEKIDDQEIREAVLELDRLNLNDKERKMVLDLIDSRIAMGVNIAKLSALVPAYMRIMRVQYSTTAKKRLQALAASEGERQY